MDHILKSGKLDSVCYDIRGAVHKEARLLEEQGQRILKLNIGNPAPFGFTAPDAIVQNIISNFPTSHGYCESKGLLTARTAIADYHKKQGVKDASPDNVYMGNGVSELIVMSMQGLLNTGDEVLIPSPDYPLWTAAVNLTGGKSVHYRCDEQSEWFPDLEDIKKKISSRTRAIVIINPNNPTGAVYSKELLEKIVELCRQHNLILFADEIYDKILYDKAEHVAVASLSDDILTVTFNGLSKVYLAAGFRVGWMMLSGNVKKAQGYIEGLDILASMRLCANVPCQHAVATALNNPHDIARHLLGDGRLNAQRKLCCDLLNNIPGVSVVTPKGALYAFAKLDAKKFNLKDDEKLVLDLLKEKKILLVHGRAFNWTEPDHLRIVFLPQKEDLTLALSQFGDFLETYKQ